MNCQETRSLMEAYLDSELDVRSVQEVREHLTACATCATAFAEEEEFHRQLQAGLKRGNRTAALWQAVEEELTRASGGAEPVAVAGSNQAAKAKGRGGFSWTWWLWPSPRYYVGLAAIWLILLPLYFASRDATPTVPASSASVTPEVRMVLAEQRRLLVELLGASSLSKGARISEQTTPSSRSEHPTQNIRV